MMKQKWSDVSDEPISETGIRSLHVPEDSYKFDAATHGAGTSFTVKGANDFVLYVLRGACRTTQDGVLQQLAAGEFMFLGKGAYHFKAGSAGDVALVCVSSRA